MFSVAARGGMFAFLAAGLMAISWGGRLGAQTFYEKWHLTTASINEGDSSFLDKWVGQDLLPYTGDDEDLPEGGNGGGTWTASWIDADGNGTFDPEVDSRFSLIRREDDDMQTLGANSEFQYGVFAEGEDWFDLHNADNQGPCADPAGQGCDYGDDFEHNDGLSNWEDRSSWFWYNNAKANQRGLGGSRYYFEWKDAVLNPGYFDEVQGWRKGLQFQRNFDNGQLPEKRCCVSHDGTIKGLFIPVAAMKDFKDGELDPLFGWYSGDMAKYVRDDLAPKLEDPALKIFLDSASCSTAGLPAGFLLILQGEFHIKIKNADAARTSAAYYGLHPTSDTPDADGMLPTDGVYRWCQMQILWQDQETDPLQNRSPLIDLLPKDGVPKNLWTRDTFRRQNARANGEGIPDSLGYLKLGCTPTPDPTGAPPADCWYFLAEGQPLGDPPPQEENPACASDHTLVLPSGVEPNKAWVQLPITGVPSLDASKGKVHAEVDLTIRDPAATVYLILVKGTKPVAFAEIQDGINASLAIGGNDLTGLPLTGQWSRIGSAALDIENAEGSYSKLDLVLDGKAKVLELLQEGVPVATFDYTNTDYGETQVDSLRVWSTGSVALDQLAILQEFSLEETPVATLFKRGDVNNDRAYDITDPVNILNYLFQAGETPTCLDSADMNDDGTLDLTDAVAALGNLFLGDADPPAPFKVCGTEAPGGTSLGCLSYPACP